MFYDLRFASTSVNVDLDVVILILESVDLESSLSIYFDSLSHNDLVDKLFF